MSKKYKIWMWILVGVGALFLITGFTYLKEDAGTAIFTIVLGLLIALPMVILYFPLEKKRKEELRKKKRAAKKKAEAEAKAKEEKARAQAEEAARRFSFYPEFDSKRIKTYLASESGPRVVLHPFLRDEKLVYAIVFDDVKKVGEITGSDAMNIRHAIDEADLVYIGVHSYETNVEQNTGDVVYHVTLQVTFRRKE